MTAEERETCPARRLWIGGDDERNLMQHYVLRCRIASCRRVVTAALRTERGPLSGCCASWWRVAPAFALYGAWTFAYLYVAAAFFGASLPGVVVALLLGLVLMLAFLIIYRKVVFPDFFDGAIAGRWRAIRAAQRGIKKSSIRLFSLFVTHKIATHKSSAYCAMVAANMTRESRYTRLAHTILRR